MGQTHGAASLAHRFAAWHRKAALCHRLLREITNGATDEEYGNDGTITVRVPAAAWRAAQDEAATPPPEPINPSS